MELDKKPGEFISAHKLIETFKTNLPQAGIPNQPLSKTVVTELLNQFDSLDTGSIKDIPLDELGDAEKTTSPYRIALIGNETEMAKRLGWEINGFRGEISRESTAKYIDSCLEEYYVLEEEFRSSQTTPERKAELVPKLQEAAEKLIPFTR